MSASFFEIVQLQPILVKCPHHLHWPSKNSFIDWLDRTMSAVIFVHLERRTITQLSTAEKYRFIIVGAPILADSLYWLVVVGRRISKWLVTNFRSPHRKTALPQRPHCLLFLKQPFSTRPQISANDGICIGCSPMNEANGKGRKGP